MRFKISTLLLMGLLWGTASFAFNVTFRVNMSEVTDAYTTPEVNGTFNGFCGGCAQMTDIGGNIWEITIDLPAGDYEYKFAADNWTIQENLVAGSSCTVTNAGFTNRFVSVVDQDLDLGTVCWSSCQDCGVAAPVYDVTFRVDMSQVTDPFTTPEVNGTFNGFCGGCAPMTDLGAGVWEITIPLEAGTYEYKFAADAWNIQEALTPGTACTVTNFGFTNRFLEVVDQNIDLGTVCWGSCEDCGVAPSVYDVTFRVDMSQVTEAYTTPEVNGTFNGFCGGCAPMVNVGGDVWELTIPLEVGTYEYKFAADTWNIQENLTQGDACTTTIDGFTNRTVTVVDQNIDLGTPCWSSCEACAVAPTTYDVTFRVNMADVTDAYTTPEVNGTFNGFCGGCAPMTNVGGDVWEITIPLEPGIYEFKYAADTWTIQENLTPGTACTITNGAFTNRLLEVVDQNIDLGTVCWGSCEDCGIAPAVYDVTFRVNMADVTDPFTTPEVNGTFNGFCGGCAPMTNVGGDVWEITIPLEVGTYEYKFAADTWNIQEELTPGTSCTVTNFGFTNRVIEVVDQNIDLGTVCWASCEDCGVAPTFYDVTFRVDMSQVAEAFTTPEVNGTFNGFCGGCAPMTNVGGDIWELTIPLQAGTYEYKFAADAWNIQENLTQGDACTTTIDGFTNRTITVADQNLDLGTPCWASCEACGTGNNGDCNLLGLTFDDAASVNPWQGIADATGPEASIAWNAAGNGTGALEISAINPTINGKAYIFEYLDAAFDYNAASTVELSFDVKFNGPYVGAALHLQTEMPGVGVVNNFDLQAQGVNENTWTNFTYTFNNVGAGNLFRMHFNIAAGAFVGAGGTVQVDNITLICDPAPSNAGCTDVNAVNYDAEALEDDGSCQYNVTFRVNMAEVTDPFTTPEVNGTFNEFCGGCAPMTNVGGDIWEITIPLQSGLYEYKFAADTWNIQEELTQGSACTVTNFGFTNRFLEVTNQNIDLGTVCWASCQDCGIVSPVYDVTFRVDMSQVTEPFTTPEVNGSFNGWCGGCAPMTNIGGDVWEITIPLEAGVYEYKFAADGWAIQEELAQGSVCTVTTDGFTNRALVVVDSNIALETVCWASCEACPPADVVGCTYQGADNYDPLATVDSGDCVFSGCTDPAANNYNPFANTDNGSCDYTVECAADLDNNGVVNVSDLLIFLGAFGNSCF